MLAPVEVAVAGPDTGVAGGVDSAGEGAEVEVASGANP